MCRKSLNLIVLSLISWACTDAATVGNENGDGSEAQAVGGGTPISGGSSGFGGAVEVGGATPISGGSSGFGGAEEMGGGWPVSGGSSGIGGAEEMGGGSPVSGGSSGFGGADEVGGAMPASGGSSGAGGAVEVGGAMPASGGTSSVGGAQAVGGGSAAGASGAAVIAQKVFGNCGFNVSLPLSTATMAFPADLATATPRVFWDQLITACSQGGWDVTACAGKDVATVTGVSDQVVTIADGNHPISVSAWIAGNKVCCLDGGTDIPGTIMSAKCDAKVLAQRTLDSCSISHFGTATTEDMDVPAQLTGPNWAIKAEACAAGGWDLTRCAGTTATFTSFAAGSSGTDKVWVVSKNDEVLCVYGSNDATPGIVSRTCQK